MIASNTLTDKAVKAAIRQPCAAGKPATVSDGDGLMLICRPDKGLVALALLDRRPRDAMPLYLLTMFAKNERANLNKAERNELAGLVDELVQIWFGR